MAHDIHKNSMVYAGETPWHRIGKKMPANADWQTVYGLAGFYEAMEGPAWTVIDGKPFQIPDRKVIYRNGIPVTDKTPDGGYLATMGRNYQIVQFSDLARAVVEACHGEQAVIHTAGLMGEKGERGWILAELPERFRVRVTGDTEGDIRPYILAATGHDGSLANHIRNCATRVVCRNTLGVALGETGGASWTIRHTATALQRMENAAQALKVLGARMLRFKDMGDQLVKCRLSDDAFEMAIKAAVQIPDDGEEHPELQERRDEIRALRETFDGVNPTIRGTAWGDFQAVTQALDWKGRASGMDAKSQADHSALGTGAADKARALKVLTTLAGVQLSKVAA